MIRNQFDQPIGAPTTFTTARRPEPVALNGRVVRLEPVEASHALSLYAAIATDASLWTYRPDEPPASVEEMGGWLAGLAQREDQLVFTICLLDQNGGSVPAGLTALLRIDPAAGSIEVGAIIYGPQLARSRAATEAQYLLMRHVFEDLGYRRYEWKCDSLNEPSRRAALRLGFTYEGRFRQALVYKGRNRDTDWFSITDAEWPTRRQRLDAWLAEDNFGPDGQQRVRLGQVSLG